MIKGQAGILLVVVMLTLLVTWLHVRSGSTGGGWAFLAGLLTLGLPVLWGLSYLRLPSLAWQLVAMSVWLALAVGVTGTVAFALGPAAYGLGGLAMGGALARRWRFDLVVVLAALLPATVAVVASAQLPWQQVLEASSRDFLETLRVQGADALDQAVQQVLLAQTERGLTMMVGIWVKFWPGFLVLAVLAHAGLALLGVIWLARTGRMDTRLRDPVPFHKWRLPFYLVWMLVGGLILVLWHSTPMAQIGANVILIVGSILSVQGLAVQSHWLGRYLPAWLRILFWTVAAVLVVPLVVMLMASAVLGLIDQWVDLRRDPEWTRRA